MYPANQRKNEMTNDNDRKEFEAWFKSQPLPTIGVVTPQGAVGYSQEALEWAFRDGQAARANSGWLPIESAPETGENYLGIIQQPDGSFGEPFICYWDIDEHHICLHQTEARLHRPTHWLSLRKLTPPKKDELI